jgi:hypothetical protein
MSKKNDAVVRYVRDHVKPSPPGTTTRVLEMARKRFTRALSLLPPDALALFLSGTRALSVMIMPTPGAPMVIKTRCYGPPYAREYHMVLYEEHLDLPEDHFIGAVLRELGHVVGQIPPEEEWPPTRVDRARFKERLENLADAMVWQWGLKRYDLVYLNNTFPAHWTEKIIQDIERVMAEPEGVQ